LLAGTITNKSRSLSSLGFPQACDPKRMTFSGLSSAARRYVISCSKFSEIVFMAFCRQILILSNFFL